MTVKLRVILGLSAGAALLVVVILLRVKSTKPSLDLPKPAIFTAKKSDQFTPITITKNESGLSTTTSVTEKTSESGLSTTTLVTEKTSESGLSTTILVTEKTLGQSTPTMITTEQFIPVMITTNAPDPHSVITNHAINRMEVLQESNFDLTMVKSSLKKKGYTLADLPPWSALWTDKIHLCVMFNLNGIKPSEDITKVLASYYFPFFKDITFFFDGAKWESQRPDYLPEFVNLISCDSHVGWYQHKCLRLCLQQGTEETKGHLYIADDMFINLTMMADLPTTTMVWYVGMAQDSYSQILNPGRKGWAWWWWGPPTNNHKRLENVIKILPSEWMNQLKRTAGFPDHFKVRTLADIIYVPKALGPNLTTVIDFVINSKTYLFCEVAVPLAVNIAAPNQVINLKTSFLWGNNRNVPNIEKAAKTVHVVHPVKLGVEPQRNLWIQLMENQLYNIITN